MKPVWCVKANDGIWCAASPNNKPADTATSVATRCSNFITLPFGTERREPTCDDCKEMVRIAQAGRR